MEGKGPEDEPLPMLPSTSSSSDSRPSGRSICTDGCDRPKSVCICAHLPPSPLPTSTTVLVLLHPHQLRQPLSTVPALRLCLLRCHLIIGRRLHPGLSPLLDSLSPLGNTGKVLYLFPGGDGLSQAPLGGDDEEEEEAEKVLIVFDGTWRHAREMVEASEGYLSGFARRVSLGRVDWGAEEGESTYESERVLRKEPWKGCLSTIEAVGRAIRILEGARGEDVEGLMLGVLEAMVGFQARHLKAEMRPRQKKKKEKKKRWARVGSSDGCSTDVLRDATGY
ncbi:hypothetical protein QJS04_geneDACA016903 [Acorus gramineus]|uniref:tRNA-uridine aminocarboxypropyltransferase n=1 Tax=Acorus gramineus TaxID=55184 RepID=A0AAV9BMK7_ACOGR|nr:hypothetical protein QJS04_geneDACA016903 [Acorus gramineus]